MSYIDDSLSKGETIQQLFKQALVLKRDKLNSNALILQAPSLLVVPP